MQHFEIYRDTAGEWRWRFVASNGRTMADSSEGYTERNDCREALDAFVGDIGIADTGVRYMDGPAY